MTKTGFCPMSREVLNGPWHDTPNTQLVWLTLLLSANWEPRQWRDITIQRGQLVTSYSNIAQQTGLTVQNVRTAIKHLKSTGDLTQVITPEYSVFTIKNYDLLCPSNKGSHSQSTHDSQQNKHYKNYKEDSSLEKTGSEGGFSVDAEPLW